MKPRTTIKKDYWTTKVEQAFILKVKGKGKVFT